MSNVQRFISGWWRSPHRSGAGAARLTPPAGTGDRDGAACEARAGTIGVLYKGTGGELIRLIKEEEHFEAVIKDEVIRASAHKKLCLYISFVETSGKNMSRRENFSVLCSRILMKDENLS